MYQLEMSGVYPMEDMQAHLEKLEADAAECKVIGKLATDAAKRELFTRLAKHLAVLAAEVREAITKTQSP